MPRHTSLLTLSFALLAATAPAAPVSVTPANLVYSQNFNTLGTSSLTWTDDSTLPGWFIQINNGGTATGTLQAANGATLLSGLLNLGATGSTDRALGSKATGTGNLANIAYAVSFRNNSPGPVALSQLQYAGELWRTNSGTGTPLVPVNEEYTVFYRISSSPVTNILSGATSANASPGAGFTALGAAADWTSPVNTPFATPLVGNDNANRTVVTVQPSAITLLPGQYLTLKWTDANEAGTDGYQGLDDVNATFTELEGVLTPTVSAPVRVSNGTPSDPSDDLFGFTVNVTASGQNLGLGWVTSDVTPPNAANAPYGTPVTWTGFPVATAKAATFTDQSSPFFSASISVPAPKLIGLNTTTPGGIVHTTIEPVDTWLVDETLRTLTMTGGPGLPPVTVSSAPVNLAAVSGAVKFSARLTARDTSSGFESDDTFLARLFLSDGTTETQIDLTAPYDADVSGAMNGVELAPSGGTAAVPTVREYILSALIPDHIQSARLVLSGNNNSSNETLVVDNILFGLAPPALTAVAGAVVINNQGTDTAADDTFTAPVTITAGNNAPSTGWTSDNPPPASGSYAAAQPVTFGPWPLSGGARTVIVTDQAHPVSSTLTLTPPAPSLTVSTPANITRRENGPGLADDTVTFDVTVTGAHGGPRWIATGALTASGSFGPVTITVPASASPVAVTIKDVSYPAAAQTLSIPVPARYTIGWLYNGTSLTDIFSDISTAPAAEWVNDPVLHTLDMATGGTSEKVVASGVLNLSATGAVWFSAVLRARETSNGSNFESTDRFKAELILDAGTPAEQIINLITPWDTGDGAVSTSGPNGSPNGWLNGYSGATLEDYNANNSRDEFNRSALDGAASLDSNFPLAHIIPSSVSTAQLRITGHGISSSEFFTVSRVLFSTVSPVTDSDADGTPDLTELTDGTDPHDPASLFTIASVITGPGNSPTASFPTVAGRTYHGYLSTDLLTWTRDDTLPSVTGDGSPKTWPLPVLPSPAAHHYLKVLPGFTPADFPATLP